MPGGPAPVEVGVPQDAEQPRLGPPGVAELVHLHLRLTNRLLCQVFGISGGAGQTVRVPVQRQVVFIDELLDASLAAGPLHAEPTYPLEPTVAGLFPAGRRDGRKRSRY